VYACSVLYKSEWIGVIFCNKIVQNGDLLYTWLEEFELKIFIQESSRIPANHKKTKLNSTKPQEATGGGTRERGRKEDYYYWYKYKYKIRASSY
jgi:hypothetical protein